MQMKAAPTYRIMTTTHVYDVDMLCGSRSCVPAAVNTSKAHDSCASFVAALCSTANRKQIVPQHAGRVSSGPRSKDQAGLTLAVACYVALAWTCLRYVTSGHKTTTSHGAVLVSHPVHIPVRARRKSEGKGAALDTEACARVDTEARALGGVAAHQRDGARCAQREAAKTRARQARMERLNRLYRRPTSEEAQ